MSMNRTTKNGYDGSYPHFSEFSDDLRAKNKREERFLEIELNYLEREKRIRLNILRKEKQLWEKKREALREEWKKAHYNQQRPSFTSSSIEQSNFIQSTPDILDFFYETKSTIEQSHLPSSKPQKQLTKSSTLPIRRHSAG